MITCSDITCKYREDKSGKCTAKKVHFSHHGVNTKYQGYQHYLKCKSYEKCEEMKRLEEKFKDIDLQAEFNKFLKEEGM